MARIRLHPEAEARLGDIYRHTQDRYGTAQAEKYLAGLQQSFEQYARFPQMGKQTTPGSPVRQALYESHRFFYRSTPGGIEIGRVLHQSQDFTRSLAAYERQAVRAREHQPTRGHETEK